MADFATADTQILKEIHEHSETMQNLEHLSDAIGPRVTGSPKLKQRTSGPPKYFVSTGLTNVHQEPWTIAHSWTRGTARARIVSQQSIHLQSPLLAGRPARLGRFAVQWCISTQRKKRSLKNIRGKLKGAIVIYQEPTSLSPPKAEDGGSPAAPDAGATADERGTAAAPQPYAVVRKPRKPARIFSSKKESQWCYATPDKPHGLLNMTGIGGEKFEIGAIPTAFITGEGYRMIFRMMKHGPVELEVEMNNSFSEKPVEVFNTVAEIRGNEKPDEVVMIGAHLDSWDLGTGSTDNGTGSMAVLEAARALAKLQLKPKRTIRFVLFTGEEEGLVGLA